MNARAYFSSLTADIGDCWNRFWFWPMDRKPLDWLRVAVGCISLYLLATLTPDLNTYFGSEGLLPVEAVDQIETGTAGNSLRGWSYLDYFTSSSELLTVHILGIVVVALFTLGLATPVTSLLTLLVMLSTVHRAPMLTSLVEPVVTMVLFYWCLGPGGPIAGITRLFTQQPTQRVSTWSTVSLKLIQVHLSLLYATMGLSKLLSESWWSGMGVWWLMARPESRLFDITGLAQVAIGDTPIGIYIINLWTHAVVAFEIAFAVLIWKRSLRPLLLGWSVVHWIGIAALLGQPLLAITMIAANAAFLTKDSAE
jgi:hypothetical protein